MKNDIYHDRFLAVYLLPCFEIKRTQTEFVIFYVTFNALQNGKKILKKKSWEWIRKMAYTVSNQVTDAEENDLGHLPTTFIHKNFLLEEIRTSS